MVDQGANSPTSCANCGTQLADRYCAHCGQDAHVKLSIRHFAAEFLEGIFHFDSTFWRTFRPLLFQPGWLTAEYLNGRRKSHAPPVRSYLVLSLLYFLIASFVTTPHTRVIGPTGQEIKPQNCAQVAANATWLRYLVQDVKGSCERALKDERHVFTDALVGTLPKVMFVVLPLVALVQYWLGRRQRPWYLENLVFILHFQSFYFLAGSLGLLLVAGIAAIFKTIGWPNEGVADWLDPVLYAWSAYYLFIANRRVYRAGMLKAGFCVAMIAVAYALFWAAGVTMAALYEFARA
ncbi:MAG: DUF3667 domain-containing protein [Steroidobacteraceae bacterium]